jgi:hypothetical protein
MSKSNQLREQLSRCVNDVLLKYSLSLTGDIMRKFPLILDSICADKSIVKSLKQKSGPAMINAILGLFGLEAIHKGEEAAIDEEIFKRFIEIDNAKATNQLEIIARELQDFEHVIDTDKNRLIEQIQEQAVTLEHSKRDYRNLQDQYDTDKNAHLVSMQQLLEAIGPNPTQENLVALTQIIGSSFEQFGLSVVWDMTNDDNSKMFFVQKTGIKRERTIQRPCLVENEKVVLKGLAYQVVEE